MALDCWASLDCCLAYLVRDLASIYLKIKCIVRGAPEYRDIESNECQWKHSFLESMCADLFLDLEGYCCFLVNSCIIYNIYINKLISKHVNSSRPTSSSKQCFVASGEAPMLEAGIEQMKAMQTDKSKHALPVFLPFSTRERGKPTWTGHER